jgi:2Fe-2S ferredoxin
MVAESGVQATLSGVEVVNLGEVTLNVIDREGAARQLPVETGTVLMHALRDNIDVDIGICGGEISCGTCLVRLNQDWFENLAAAGADEREMLEALQARDNARLACQIVLDESADGMQATLLHED